MPQQWIGPEAVQKRRVACIFKQSVETSFDAVVKDDFRIMCHILGVVVLQQIIPVDAEAAVSVLPVCAGVCDVAGKRREYLPADYPIVPQNRLADIDGKNHVDLPGLHSLKSIRQVAVADELHIDAFSFEIQAFGNFTHGVDCGTERLTVFTPGGKRKIVVEVSDAKRLVLIQPIPFLVCEAVAEHRVGEILLFQPGQIVDIVFEDVAERGIDVGNQIRSRLVCHEIIRGRPNFLNRRQIALREHADLKVKVDLPGEQIGLLVRDGLVFDNVERHAFLFTPII